MPTPAERKALMFLSGLVMLGTAVRLVGVVRGAPPPPDAAAQQALDHQLAAVDSARAHGRHSHRARQRRPHADSIGTAPEPRVLHPAPVSARPSPGFTVLPPVPIDLDRASAAEIEALPRIGPRLAQRIVANRDSLGPFGSLEGLRRVRGVGPGMVKQMASMVTFSLGPRPFPVDDTGPGSPARKGRRRVRQPRAP